MSFNFVNRAVDVLLCLAILPVAAPICAVLLLLIRVESPGSPLFVQSRVGRLERPFSLLKLRTMTTGTADLPSHEVGGHRITRLGKILRRLKLDELPQLINVLSGEMALVGPRPCLPSQNELISARRHRGLFALRPGVTGPGQLAGLDMSEPQRLAEVEAAYFEHASPWDNIVLIARTFVGGGAGDAALKPRS